MEYIELPLPVLRARYKKLDLLTTYLDSKNTSKFDEYFIDKVPVVPENLRPTVQIEDKKIIHPLTIRYDSLKSYINYLKEQGYEPSLITKDIDENLKTDWYHLQNIVNNLVSTIIEILSHKEGLIRQSLLGCVIDFSGRAVVIPHPSLKTYQITLPEKAKIIWPEGLRYLIDEGKLDELLNTINDINAYKVEKRRTFLGRQPTLWRFGAVQVDAIDFSDEVIRVSPTVVEPFNMDFDGDTAWFARAESEDAENAHILNFVKYDHNDTPLYTIRHEAIVAVVRLLRTKLSNEVIEVNSLDQIPEDYVYKDEYPIVRFQGSEYHYGIAILNKWCGFREVKWTDVKFNKKKVNDLTNMIIEDCESNEEYYDRLFNLQNKLFQLIGLKPITINIQEIVDAVDFEIKLPKNPVIGSHIIEMYVNKAIDNLDADSNLGILYESGARFSKAQLCKCVVSGGYVATADNQVLPHPIEDSLVNGLSWKNFFISSFGTRKALLDKTIWTPRSGYLERSLVLSSPMRVEGDDCGTLNGIRITIPKDLIKHFENRMWRFSEDEEWRIGTPPSDKEIILRSPITCNQFHICRKCLQMDIKIDNIGVVAAQCISERLTQLILRTFHTSGFAVLPVDDKVVDILTQKLYEVSDDYIILKDVSNEELNLIVDKTQPAEIISEDKLCKLIYERQKIKNDDAVSALNSIYDILKFNNNPNPGEDLIIFVYHYSKLGKIYIPIIEVALANFYWISINDKISLLYRLFLKYQDKIRELLSKLGINAKINLIKYGVRQVPKMLSTQLHLLYEPNAEALQKYFQTKTTADSTHERLFNVDKRPAYLISDWIYIAKAIKEVFGT